MKRSASLLLLSLVSALTVILITSCKSLHKKTTKGNMTSNQNVQHDTMSQQTSKIPTANMPKLAPGTADIAARVIMYDESAPMYVTIQVVGVNAYGTSTPALGQGAEIRADISKSLLNKHSLGEIKEEFTTSDTLSLVLSFSQQVAVGGVSHKWTIISFNKN